MATLYYQHTFIPFGFVNAASSQASQRLTDISIALEKYSPTEGAQEQ